MDQEERNARIESTMLGFEDHGIMTCMIGLDYGGVSQGFGGYAFDEWNEKKQDRIPTAAGTKFIKRLLEVVGVEKWEDLKGKYVRAVYDNGTVYRIGNVLKDEWLIPGEVFKDGK